MAKKYIEFKPEWKLDAGGGDTYRAKLKWGNPDYRSEPGEALYIFLKEKLNLSDEDFIFTKELGDERIEYAGLTRLNEEVILEFEAMLGRINVRKDALSRVSAAYGKSVYDNMRLRKKIIENIPDVVLTPVNEEQIVSIMKYCMDHDIPIYPSGGRTNCNRSAECYAGGVCLDLSANFNKVIAFSEPDQTVTVMSGISGPGLEEFLNNISDYFPDIAYRYTLGHIPQSFEFSTVGGWVMSRSYGDNATTIGGISDLIVSARYLTPRGIIDTSDTSELPMPNADSIFIGSYGSYGILLSVTLKVRRYTLDGTREFSYILPNLETAIKFVKEVCQGENGLPYSLQLCDSGRTEMIMRMFSENKKTPFAAFIRELHKDSERCLVMGKIMGERSYGAMLKRFIGRTSAQFGGRSATKYIAKNWERTRFNNAYMSDLLMDYGIVIDKLDCRLPWSKAVKTYYHIKSLMEKRPFTFVMASINHQTAHSCSLQFEFVAKYDSLEDYREFIAGVIEEASKIGVYMTSGFGLIDQSLKAGSNLSMTHAELLYELKRFFDPKSIMRRGANKELAPAAKPRQKNPQKPKNRKQ